MWFSGIKMERYWQNVCEVVKKKRFGMARSVRGEEFTISGEQQELIAIENPYYSAMVKKIGEGKWTLESLALSSDANYSDIQHKSINRLDYLNTIRNYNGILSVLSNILKIRTNLRAGH